MFKSVFAASAALSLSAGAAFAGPYVRVETNAGWAGNDYNGAVTELQLGYDGELGENASWYVEGGPALVSVDGEDNETEIAAEIGASVALSDSIGLYGELSFLTSQQDFEELNTGAKLGVKYSF
jgi:hypothetical protein